MSRVYNGKADLENYRHKLNSEYLRQQFAGPWMRSFQEVRATVGGPSSAEYNLTVALSACFEGVAFAHALRKQDLVTQLRQTTSEITKRTIESFDPAEIQRHSSHLTLAHTGIGTDPTLIGRYAATLVGRRPPAPPMRDAHPYREDLLDGLVALVTGDDAAAQEASARVHQQLQEPGTAPTVHLGGIPHAIDAVARRDQGAFDKANEHAVQWFSRAMAGTVDHPAGPRSLLHSTLTLIARTATWRGMNAAPNPYVLPIDEPSLLIKGTAG